MKIEGLLSPSMMDLVNKSTLTIFKDNKYGSQESYIMYKQNVLDEETLLRLTSEEAGRELKTPTLDYMTADVIAELKQYYVVPIKVDNITSTIEVGVLPEDMNNYIPPLREYKIIKVPVPIYWFIDNYERRYSIQVVNDTTPDILFRWIVDEALRLGAADITISQLADRAQVFYNVRKRIVMSERYVRKIDVDEIVEYVLAKANSAITGYTEPVYFAVPLDFSHRGRCVLTKTYYGYKLSIRVLSNDLFNTTFEDLNISERATNFLRDHALDFEEKGLRIFIGETFSGKNTTIAAAIKELNGDFKYNGVSVEQPVEILMDVMSQHNCETDKEYTDTVNSLVRQNPDFIYVTEITDRTAKAIMNVSNTGKVVFTSVHANSISDVPMRLQDLTGYSLDRAILNLQSVIYQRLVRDEETDKIYPVNKCIHFSDEFKSTLYGKSVGEIKETLRKEESKWD